MQGTGNRSWATLDGRDNALNTLRLALAMLVIVGHSWELALGREVSYVPSFAVDGFFALSGYLIAGSRLKTPFVPFMWRRALRIFPGLWVCLLVTAFVLAPLSTLFTGRTVHPSDSVGYVLSNAALQHEGVAIGDTLSSAPLSYQWNGSLWTLGWEFGCYVAVGVAMTLPWFRARAFAVLLAVLAVLVAVRYGVGMEWLPLKPIRLGGFFAAGVLVRLARPRVPLSGVLAAAAGVVVLVAFLGGPLTYYALAPIPLAYVLLWLACALPVRVGAVNDISYGLYVYGFPVQQLLVAAGVVGVVGIPGFAVVAVVVTVALALASWLLVERPAMRLRRLVQPTFHTSTAIADRNPLSADIQFSPKNVQLPPSGISMGPQGNE